MNQIELLNTKTKDIFAALPTGYHRHIETAFLSDGDGDFSVLVLLNFPYHPMGFSHFQITDTTTIENGVKGLIDRIDFCKNHFSK